MQTDCVCDPGWFGQDGDECMLCMENSFCPGGNVSSACPGNSSSEKGSWMQTDCVCNAGWVAEDGDECMLCLQGFWCPGGNVSYACPGNSSSEVGSWMQVECECPPGWVGQDGDACSRCNKDSFCPGGNVSKSCPGNSSSELGSGMQTDCQCNPGWFGEDGEECILCKEDFWCPGGALNFSCPGNSTAVAGSSRLEDCTCPRAFFLADDQSCMECTVGFWCPGGNQIFECPRNSSTSLGSTGQTDCNCIAGFRGEAGGACTQCIEGIWCPGGNESFRCPADSTSDVGSSAKMDCRCVPGYSGPPGGPCALCQENFWCPGVGPTNSNACPNNSSAEIGSVAKTDCVCDPGFRGENGGNCTLCPVNFWCPGGNESFRCAGNAFTEQEGSSSNLSCACPPGYAVLFNMECAMLGPPQMFGSGTFSSSGASSGSYVGFARVTIIPPSYANISYTTDNASFPSCANMSTARTTVTVKASSTVTAISCGLDFASGPPVSQIFRIAEGAKVSVSFTINGLGSGVSNKGLKLGLLKQFARSFNLPEYQLDVTTITTRRTLLATTAQVDMLAANPAEFSSVLQQANSLTDSQLSSLVASATGDNSLSASDLQVVPFEGALADINTPIDTPDTTPEKTPITTPIPEEPTREIEAKTDNGPNYDVGAIAAVSVVCAIGIFATAAYLLWRLQQTKTGSTSPSSANSATSDLVFVNGNENQRAMDELNGNGYALSPVYVPDAAALAVAPQPMPTISPPQVVGDIALYQTTPPPPPSIVYQDGRIVQMYTHPQQVGILSPSPFGQPSGTFQQL